jgi:putative peptidoglycan lipid II flippase
LSSVLRAAGAMGIATFLSRILGLVREQVFAVMFGAGNATDAFNVAFRIPNLLRDLFAEGAMSTSLVPVFTNVREKEGQERAWQVAGRVFRVLFVVVSLLVVVGILLAPSLVSLYAGAFEANPEKYELTVRMTRMMFPFFSVVALAAAFMGILNASGVFFLPAFASALFNLTSIVVGVAASWLLPEYGPRLGLGSFHPIEGMAIGVLAGGAVQAFCQLPALYKVGYRWQPRKPADPSWRQDPALKRMVWMMVPGIIGLSATQVAILVNTILATSQGAGAVSWLNYAFRLMQFPIGVFGVSLAAATLPRISTQWARQDAAGAKETLSQSMRQVFAINLPAAAGLAFLGYPIVQLIFEYGQFEPGDTSRTAFALGMYAIGLPAYSAVKVLVPACYAFGNTRLPVISSLIAVAVTIAMNLALIGPFGYWGLALGTSVAACVNALFLLGAVRKLLGDAGARFELGPLLVSFLKNLGVSLGMGALCLWSWSGVVRLVPEAALGAHLGRMGVVLARGIHVGALIVEGVVLVLVLSKVLRVQETTEALQLFTTKVKKKLSHTQR